MDFELLFTALLHMMAEWFKGMFLFFVPRHWRCKDINNEIVLITGGGSGIGRLLAQRLHSLNNETKFVLWDINNAGLKETAKLLGNERVWTYICDVSDRTNVYEVADRVRADVGHVTMLVNNAGIVSGTRFLETKDESIIRTMNVNTLAHFWTVKAFLPEMMNQNHGHLIFVASIAGIAGGPRLADYCASKYANLGMEESLRFELKAEGMDGIHSTLVCPWFINTGMFEGTRSEVIPFQEPEYVADQMVLGILSNQEVLFIPRFMYFLFALKSIMPAKSAYLLLKSLGGDRAMSTFKGREVRK